jgi:hypothetical protein
MWEKRRKEKREEWEAERKSNGGKKKETEVGREGKERK